MFVGCARVDQAIGEVGPATARNSNFLGHFVAVVNQQDGQAQLPGNARTKQSGSAGTYDHHITCLHALGV